MELTPAEAAKLLKKYKTKYTVLFKLEERSCCFCAALGEDPETARTEYDYEKTKKELEDLELKIRRLNCALNIFNNTHKVPGFDMTVDEMLVYIPQLTYRKEKLAKMSVQPPKSRHKYDEIKLIGRGGRTHTRRIEIKKVEYTYANYDIEAVRADYEKAADELARAQTALDELDSTATFEIEL